MALLSALALALFAAGALSAAELIGVRDATFEWAPSPGSTVGYVVYVSRNGTTPRAIGFVSTRSALIEDNDYNDEISVSIRGIGPGPSGDFILTPFSPPSSPLAFRPPPRLDGSGNLVLHCAECDLLRFRRIDDGEDAADLAALSSGWDLVAVADFDGTYDPDLLWRNEQTGTLVVQMLDGHGPVGGAGGSDPTLASLRVVGARDLDGDGTAEIVLARDGTGRAEIWTLLGSAVLPSSRPAGPANATLVGLGDFNGDGLADLLWRALGEGAAPAEPAPEPEPEPVASSNPFAAFFAAIFALFSGLFGIFGGGGSSAPAPTPPPPPPPVELSISYAPGFEAPVRVEAAPSVPDDWSVVGASDYDGDGRADVLFRDDRTSALVLWRISSNTLAEEISLPGDPQDEHSDVVLSHDFVGGQNAEIVLQDRRTGRLALVDPLNRTDPVRLVFADVGTRWRAVAVED